MTHATLLARVQMMERELHEKQIAQERSRKLAAEARLRFARIVDSSSLSVLTL
jgi:hypothetical protein